MISKFDYNKMATVASNLLNRFGGANQITIEYPTGEAFDVATQTNVKTTDTFTGWGVIVPFQKTEIDGELIEAQDLRLILEKTSRVPEIDNVVTFKGQEYRIMGVEPKTPGGIDIVYFCQLRI